MSNRTVFKIPELKREYESSKQDMLDQKQNIESLVLALDDNTIDFTDLIKEIDKHIDNIDIIIDKLPSVLKVREKDTSILNILILQNDEHIKAHFALAEKINNAIMPLISDLIPDTDNNLNALTAEIKQGL